MKLQKFLLFAFASLFILTSITSATSINCNLFYSEDPTAYTQVIEDGDSVSLVVDANTVLEEKLTIKVELYREGTKVKDIMHPYTTIQEYFGILNIKKSDYLIAGNYTIRAFANSSSGSFSQDHVELFVESIPITPDTTSPQVTILNPSQGGNYTTNKTSLTFQLIEKNIDYCEYNLNDGRGWKNYSCINGTNIISGIKSNEGVNTWQVKAIDKSSNVGGDFITFNVTSPIIPDTTSPQVTVVSPKNGQLYYTDYTYKNQLKFNISENENLSYCQYNLNDGQGWKNYSCINGLNTISGLDFSIGFHLWEIKAIDSEGNVGEAITAFQVEPADNEDPIIHMITPKNNTEYTSFIGQFVVNITDIHLSKYCTYKLNNNSEKTFLCKNGINSITGISTVEGQNKLEISAKDFLSGNKTKVEIFFTINLSNLTLDITPPTISIIHPAEGQEFNESDNIYIEIITDENATVYYNINGTNITMDYVNGTFYNFISDNFNLSPGNYTVTIYAIDSSGNVATKTLNFIVKEEDSTGGGSDEDDEEKDRKRKPNEDNYLHEYPWNMTNPSPCITDEIRLEPELTWWQKFVLWLKRLFGLD